MQSMVEIIAKRSTSALCSDKSVVKGLKKFLLHHVWLKISVNSIKQVKENVIRQMYSVGVAV